MEIIIKKYSDSQRFVPHTNRELGKVYHDKRTYLSDMKKAGLEPYKPNEIKKNSPKPYVRSEWGKEMLNDIKNRNGRKPGEKFLEELNKRGINQKNANRAREVANGR